MKKQSNLYYGISILFGLVSVVEFISSDNWTLAIMGLCLCSCFLCVGVVNQQKEKENH